MKLIKGSERTKEFYDVEGWRVSESGAPVDRELFGVKENGPLRKEMFDRRWSRINDFIKKQGGREVLEVGCGGSPEAHLLDMFETYTGTDFSSTGLDVARTKFEDFRERVKFVETDAVSMPFRDESFDAVYSAHMIYHIEDRASQVAALREMLRVLRPGGSLILITANPRPLLFPMRLGIRVVADTPYLSAFARKLKGSSPIPYNPPKLRWYKRMLGECSEIGIFSGGIASTSFNQSVTEYSGAGRMIWSFFNSCDRSKPKLSAHLGNYAVVTAKK